MPVIKIYSASYCSYCQDAKQFFAEKGISFQEIDVTNDPQKRQWLREVTKRTTVPQVFIDGIAIGGYSDLMELDQQGKLEPMLSR